MQKNSKIETPSSPESSSSDTFTSIPEKTSLKVYLNNVMLDLPYNSVYLEGNIAKVDTISTACSIFPEIENLSDITEIEGTPLRLWASFYGYSYYQEGVRIYLNNDGQKPIKVILENTVLNFSDQQPVFVSNRVLVPVRAIAEALGCQISYENTQITITNSEYTIIFWIDTNTYTINGVEKITDVPPCLVNNRSMIPVRVIAEIFNYNVDFTNTGDIASVTLNK